MEGLKIFLKGIRDAVAYCFSWLVICVILVSLLAGNDIVTVSFLIKLFMLCLWGAISFTICFRNKTFAKKGFMFSLTIFYILFIPVEILMFYLMGIFQTAGGAGLWIIFAVIVVAMYIISAVIDSIVMKKKSEDYTKKLLEYKNNI